MKHRILTTFNALILGSLSSGAWANGVSPVQGNLVSSSAPARPGHFAELEELEAARKAGTLAAYDLFLARYPTSRYAETARQERAALAGK